jgi:hypothetical protein
MNPVGISLAAFSIAAASGALGATATKKEAESKDSIRDRCIAEATKQVPADMPRRRENLITLCIERNGKL